MNGHVTPVEWFGQDPGGTTTYVAPLDPSTAEILSCGKETDAEEREPGSGDDLSAQLARYRDLLGSIWLYVNWRHVTTQLTTEQKELWADAVDACGEAGDSPVDRWWS